MTPNMKNLLMKCGLVTFWVGAASPHLGGIFHQFANNSAPLLLSGNPELAQLAVLIALVVVAGFRIFIEGKLHLPSFEGFGNWAMLKWVSPLIIAQVLYIVLCLSFGLTMEMSFSGESMRILAILGLLIVVVSALLETVVTHLFRGVFWLRNWKHARP